MFRLTNKGSQSRNNHKILHQTTKISDHVNVLSGVKINLKVYAPKITSINIH